MLTLRRLALGLFVAVALGTVSPAGDETRVLTWGDQGDGTYRNPVLKADYSDPDVIRVGDDFYLVASDFHYVGMQVLHSRDLVNWEVVGQVFPRLDMHPKYDEMNGYAQGTWAPTLRHHDGRFYVYVCTPYDGLFMWHATDPRGPWSETVTVKAVERWEDPAPFWDDDGKAYLVHSVLGAGPLILHRMSPDGRTLLDDGVEIYRGPVAEGPKLFKRGGDYYISLPEGGVETGRPDRPSGEEPVRALGAARRPGRRQPPPGRARRAAERRVLVRRLQVDRPPRPRLPPPPGEMGRGRLAGVRRRGPDGGSLEEARRLPPAADRAPADERRVRRAGARSPVAVESQPRPRGVVPRGPARLAPARGPAGHRHVAGAEHAHPEALGRRRHLRGPPRRGLDGQRPARGPHVHQRRRLRLGGPGHGRRHAPHPLGAGRGPGGRREGALAARPLRGRSARLEYSLDGQTYTDTGAAFPLRFGHWKGARVGIFCYGRDGHVDVDAVRYVYSDQPGRDTVAW